MDPDAAGPPGNDHEPSSPAPQRAADLVRQILTFARGTEGRRTVVPPRQLLEELGKILNETLPKSIHLHLHDTPDARPLGQRVLMPYQLSHTDIYAEADDLHFVNNAAMQQAWDDIRRTVVSGLDTAHTVIEKRLGKEVTPETINRYLEAVNHTMPGGAVVQEHMAESAQL